MWYIRHSLYDPTGAHPPITMIFPEDSLKVDVWTAATQMRADVSSHSMLCAFLDIEVFEHEGGLVSASAEAKERAKERIGETTRHKNTLYDWLISNFVLLKDKGTISTTKASPLEKKDILEVLMRIVKHPSYRGFSISIHDRNEEEVTICVDTPTAGSE